MSGTTIESLLSKRSAWLKGQGGDRALALNRAGLTRRIADEYPVFERLRDALLDLGAAGAPFPFDHRDHHRLVLDLKTHGLVKDHKRGLTAAHVESRKFLSGGWLEELAFLAAHQAGASETLFGQTVRWKVGDYSGENEIDLIARQGDLLSFVSCKALRSTLESEDRKQRNRLMDALHEADNLADHFGRPGERVGVLVTTDLFDEMRGVPRYTALMGKAAVLDVRIIPLEELGWSKLVGVMSELWEERQT
jgi:hypothetical protein